MTGKNLKARLADESELAAIVGLLETNQLPTEDLALAKPQFVVVTDTGMLVGAGALEHFGPAALLRSVVVAGNRRGGGVGKEVVAALEALARQLGANNLFLLTQTAQSFFAHLGYQVTDRGAAPAPVQSTAEFQSLCPASAVCMSKRLALAQREVLQ